MAPTTDALLDPNEKPNRPASPLDLEGICGDYQLTYDFKKTQEAYEAELAGDPDSPQSTDQEKKINWFKSRMTIVRQRPPGAVALAEYAAIRRMLQPIYELLLGLGAHVYTAETLLWMALDSRAKPLSKAHGEIISLQDLRRANPQLPGADDDRARCKRQHVENQLYGRQRGKPEEGGYWEPGITERLDLTVLRKVLLNLAEAVCHELDKIRPANSVHYGVDYGRVDRLVTFDGQLIAAPIMQRPPKDPDERRDFDERARLLNAGYTYAKEEHLVGWNAGTIVIDKNGPTPYAELVDARGRKDTGDREIDIGMRGIAFIHEHSRLRPELYVADMGSEAAEFHRYLHRRYGVFTVVPIDEETRKRWAREHGTEPADGIRPLCAHCNEPMDDTRSARETWPNAAWRDKHGLNPGDDVEDLYRAQPRLDKARTRFVHSKCGQEKSLFWHDDPMVHQRLPFMVSNPEDVEGAERAAYAGIGRAKAESFNNQQEAWGIGQEDGNRQMTGKRFAAHAVFHQLTLIAMNARMLIHLNGDYMRELERIDPISYAEEVSRRQRAQERAKAAREELKADRRARKRGDCQPDDPPPPRR